MLRFMPKNLMRSLPLGTLIVLLALGLMAATLMPGLESTLCARLPVNTDPEPTDEELSVAVPHARRPVTQSMSATREAPPGLTRNETLHRWAQPTPLPTSPPSLILLIPLRC